MSCARKPSVTLMAIALLLSSSVLMATTDGGAGRGLAQTSAQLAAQSDQILAFLFGPAMRLAGVFGGAYGVLQAVLAASVRPLITWGAIGLAVNSVPSFINGIFTVSGMLIP